MKKKHDTAVVILNWNGRSLLQQFLQKVVDHSANVADVIVADNASTDDSVAYIKAHFPEVSIIQNTVNGGYSKGYNDALKQIDHSYYVLLNSDVEVTAYWIEPIISMMKADTSIAAAQPKVLAYHHKQQFEYAGAAGGFIDKMGYPFCRGRIFNSFENDLGQYNDVKEIFWATGACLFIRADLFHKAGGLDEDFFAHMEEIDLCWRIKNMGYKIIYNPNAIIYHVGGGTLDKIKPQKTYLNFRNNLILLCKNHAPQFFYLKLFQRMILDGIAGVKFLLSAQPDHCWAVVRAHASFYSTFGKTLQKRNQMKKHIKHFATTAIYRKSLVWDYFVKGKRKFADLDETAF